jgi:glycosyltransferase involved in cell wall biosynthesis
MDYRPNVDAMLWFTSEIWPLVRKEFPDARLVVVGQKPHRRLQRLRKLPGVTLTGFVPDVRPYIASAHVFVVPLRMGSGTRLKVLQAMAMGKAIVSTNIGAEGLGVRSGRELLLADSPQAFTDAVVSLLKDGRLRERLGASAQEFVSARFDWSVIAPKLGEVYAPIL